MDIIEHIVQIISQKVRKRRHRADTQNVDPLAFQNGFHCPMELLPADGLAGLPQFLHIGMEHCGDHIMITQSIVGHLNALYGSEPVQHHFPHGFLHAGIAVKAQVHRKTDHGGFGHTDGFAQTVGGHKGGLVIGVGNIAGDPLLALGKGGLFFLQYR